MLDHEFLLCQWEHGLSIEVFFETPVGEKVNFVKNLKGHLKLNQSHVSVVH